ncbi:MAG: BTAD domain-containing putative transcriptional regulator, partial [Actinomycetota bacterium]
LLADRRPEEAIPPATAALRVDPLQERAHRVMISARLALGDRRGALDALDHCRGTLADAGLHPSEETLMVARALDAAGQA